MAQFTLQSLVLLVVPFLLQNQSFLEISSEGNHFSISDLFIIVKDRSWNSVQFLSAVFVVLWSFPKILRFSQFVHFYSLDAQFTLSVNLGLQQNLCFAQLGESIMLPIIFWLRSEFSWLIFLYNLRSSFSWLEDFMPSWRFQLLNEVDENPQIFANHNAETLELPDVKIDCCSKIFRWTLLQKKLLNWAE